MTKEIVQLCLADRKTQLEEKNKELEQVQIDLSKAEFFEDIPTLRINSRYEKSVDAGSLRSYCFW